MGALRWVLVYDVVKCGPKWPIRHRRKSWCAAPPSFIVCGLFGCHSSQAVGKIELGRCGTFEVIRVGPILTEGFGKQELHRHVRHHLPSFSSRTLPAQGAGVTRNFDLCVAPKSVAGETAKPYVFSGIDRSEYTSLYSFLSTKKLRIKNIKQSGNDKAMLQLGDLDDHDPYKAALDDDQVLSWQSGTGNRVRRVLQVEIVHVSR